MAAKKYKIMVKMAGKGLGNPMISEIRRKRFTSKSAAEAFCEGINMYRAANIAKITATFVAVEDKGGGLEDA